MDASIKLKGAMLQAAAKPFQAQTADCHGDKNQHRCPLSPKHPVCTAGRWPCDNPPRPFLLIKRLTAMPRRLISFDWALKRLLRSKANFDVLEGFLSELLKEDIAILEVLDGESNKVRSEDKFNRVDLKVKNQRGEIVLIEVQYEREFDYLQRILYGTSKAITEHLAESQAYSQVIKVISVNILYFDLGHGEDYLYHGSTRFTGLHRHDALQLSSKQQSLFHKQYPHELFPEYYLLKINQFDDIARDTLDEWIYFLKHEQIKDEFRAKGLQKAKEILDVMRLSDSERAAYERHAEDLHYQASMYESTYVSGKLDGIKEGMEQGMAQGMAQGQQQEKLALARLMKQNGEAVEKIARYTQLTLDEIAAL
jgi:predicted transposase/invertase (TIGR01784 family)